MKFVLVGAGSRGMTYGPWAKQHGMEITAIAEKRPDRLKSAGDRLGVPDDMRFSDAAPLFALGKLAGAAIIATMDRDHYSHVMQALDCGYDILLEKPISPDPRECIAIEDKANALGRKITVCHVLRYTNFFTQIKEILDSGELGKVVFVEGGSVSCEGGEGAQFGYVAAELMGEAVEDDAEEDGYREGEPEEAHVCGEGLDEFLVVGQGGADDVFLLGEVAGDVEVLMAQGAASAVYVCSFAVLEGFYYLVAEEVVGHGLVVFEEVVVEDISALGDDGGA